MTRLTMASATGIGLVVLLFVVAILAPPSSDCVATKSKPCPVKVVELKPGHPEALYEGFVRSINWQERSFVYESVYGYVRVVSPVCRRPDLLPIWQGMRVSRISFHWHEYSEDELGCFVLDSVEHSPFGDVKP